MSFSPFNVRVLLCSSYYTIGFFIHHFWDVALMFSLKSTIIQANTVVLHFFQATEHLAGAQSIILLN